MTTAIDVEGLTKRYGDVLALDDLDLEIQEGEIFGFLGPNGAGKSTTIDVLLDFVRPTAGRATVLGMDAQDRSRAVRRRVGVLPDAYHVYDRLTGRQHVQFAIDSKDSDDEAQSLLERVGIEGAADRKAGGYSAGMRQRLVLAMSLVGQPDLLVLDEPTSGLDPSGARDVRHIIREERDRGATVFFSSHVLSQVEAVCDRVGILHEGRLVALDTIEGLRESVAAEARLTVRVDDLTDQAVDAVEALEGVSSVVVEDRQLSITCDDGAKTDVIVALEANGASVRDFETAETSLEELFVQYTTEAEGEAAAAEAIAPVEEAAAGTEDAAGTDEDPSEGAPVTGVDR